MQAPARLLAATGLASICGGCAVDAFLYTSDRYAGVQAVNVRLDCQDTYQVFDRKAGDTLLVVASGLVELLGCASAGPLPERQRRVAEIFLSETTRRPLCRLTGEAALTDLHREFTYRCPPPVAYPAPRR